MNTIHIPNVMNHPCYNKDASKSWGRVHLPVAPHCNIQCNYCNRMYDCANEHRPGVTKQVYTPEESVQFLTQLFKKRNDISVVGIAGPGDPMCDAEATLETFSLVKAAFPHALLCLSSNGLAVPDYIDDIARLGISHVTITVNTIDPHIGAKLYKHVDYQGQRYTGLEGARILLARQEEAVRKLKEHNIIVKLNSVVVPDVNMDTIPDVARKAQEWGVDLMNCIAMIPVHDTPFADMTGPSADDIHNLRAEISPYVTQMTHCQRCRADAVGKLCESV